MLEEHDGQLRCSVPCVEKLGAIETTTTTTTIKTTTTTTTRQMQILYTI